MKILIAASTYPPDGGGPAIHARAQYDYFRRQGIDTGLVALAHYRNLPIGIRHAVYFFKLLSEVPTYDIVYAHDAVGAGIPALCAAKLYRKKFMVRIGGDVAWERKADRGETDLSLLEWYKAGLERRNLLFILSRFLLRRADAIVVPSPLLSKLYEETYGVQEERVHVIPNPIPRENTAGAKKGKSIIYASRLVAYKNLPTVFEALVPLYVKHPDLDLIIMGSGPERKSLEESARALGLLGRIKFLGAVSQTEVLERTRECLFAIGPALTEFNPNYILQCIGFGKPFLVSKENGFPFEVPKDLVFDPRDASELTNRIENLLNPTLYQQAASEVKSIPVTSWDDCLSMNLAIAGSLLNGQK